MTDVVDELPLWARLPPRIEPGPHRNWSLRSKAAWNEERRKRIAKVESGIVKLVSANEVFA